MKKRIAILINSLSGGGAERVVSRISYELNKKYKLYILLIEGDKKFYDCAGKIVDIGCKSDNYMINAIYATVNFNKIISNYKIECVISFLDVPNIINGLFNYKSKKYLSVRNCAYINKNTSIIRKIKYNLCGMGYKRADGVITVAEELNEEIMHKFKIPSQKMYVIENPYDVDEISELSKIDIPDYLYKFIVDNKTAVAVGRLDKQKNYEFLLEIFSDVYKKNKRAALIIIGEGNKREMLEKMIREKGMEERVVLLGLCKNPFSYISKSHIYISASEHEGFPNTLVEALACGIPAIHMDCKTGPREIMLEDYNIEEYDKTIWNKCGVLIPSYTRGKVDKEFTKKEFVDAWLGMLEKDNLASEYYNQCKMKANEYTMKKCIDKFIKVIDL